MTRNTHTGLGLAGARVRPALVLSVALAAGCADRAAPDRVAADRAPADRSPAQEPAGAPAEASAPERYDFTPVDRILERAAPRLGGCALVLVKDGRVVYRKAFGRYAADRAVPIASATKWLSGAVIMGLVDEGKLSLDDPASKYLPGFDGPKAAVTVRQLFAHTSGLPPEAACRNDRRTTLEACAGQIARLSLRAEPGSRFHYGGASMQAGGRIAEIAAGKPWSELFEEKIAGPLGLRATDYFAYGETRNPRIAGDGRSSADEYARFLAMLLAGGRHEGRRVLSEAAVAEMHRDHTGGAPIVYTIYEKFGRLEPSLLEARYGVGMWREVVDEKTGALLEASSQGALGFSPWIDLERNLAGVLSVRSSQSRIMPVYLDVKREIRRIVPPRGPAGH